MPMEDYIIKSIETFKPGETRLTERQEFKLSKREKYVLNEVSKLSKPHRSISQIIRDAIKKIIEDFNL